MRKFVGHGRTPRLLQVVLLAATLFTSQHLLAMTFTVNDQSDMVDANPGDGICSTTSPPTATPDCTLRAAVQEANAWPGPDVIRLPAGIYILTIANDPSNINENQAATGDLDISDDLTINGADKTNTIIDGNTIDRVIDVVSTSASVTLANVTIRNGQLNGSDVTGAGINNIGTLTILDSVITNNGFSQQIGGGGGGGIATVQGSLTIKHSDINRNSASGFAGIQVNLGSMTITDSSVTDNNSQGSGGGIGIFNGDVTIKNTTISGNSGGSPGGEGGGINNGGHVTVISSTIDHNSGVAQGGGIANVGTGTTTVINSTVLDNTAEQGNGGGILNLSGGQSTSGTAPTVILINSTIAGNEVKGFENHTDSHIGYGGGLFYSGTTVRLKNTIISNNTAAPGQGDNCSTGEGAPAGVFTPGFLDSQGYNLAGDTSCPLTGAGDQTNTDPLLAAVSGNLSLADNGGPTQTDVLSSGSPAIDHGNPAGCTNQNGAALTTDQRAFPRPDSVSALCDIGAVEMQPNDASLVDLSVHTTEGPSPINPGDSLVYRVTITDDGPGNATGVNLTDTLPANTTFASATFDSGHSGGSCSATGVTVTCSVGNVAVGSPATVTLSATVPTTATAVLNNTATVTGSETDPNTANNTDSVSTAVNLSADLQLSMAGAATAVLNQDNVTYTINVASNAGSDTVPNVAVVDSVPGAALLVANSTKLDGAVSTSCTENAGAKTVVCQLGSMAASDSHTITFTVTPTVKGTMVNTATVNFDGTDTDPSNNKSAVTTDVRVIADLAVAAIGNPDPSVVVNNDLQYIINVTNHGPSPSTDAVLTATLPSAATFTSASTSQGTCTPPASGSSTLTCDLKSMGDGAQATVTVFVVPTVVGSIQFGASVTGPADETDSDTSNNSTIVTTSVEKSTLPSAASADLTMGLTGGPNPVTAGSTLTYTLTVTNKGPDDATGVIAVLSLPASVQVAASPGAGCAKDSTTNFVRCNLGTIAANHGAQTTVAVTPTQNGVITATASVNFVGTDPDKTNNSATTATTVNAPPPPPSGKGGGAMGAVTLSALLLLYGVTRGGRRRARAGRRHRAAGNPPAGG